MSWAGQPTWFGSDTAPLFGVVHSPAGGRVRGGVVICPPLGKEHVDTYRGLKLLAQRLATAGFAVLRFDYLGTGDSAQFQGADSAVADYRAGIVEAARYLRGCGAPDVSVIGLRMGALLAAVTTQGWPDLANLVLWDPVTDGRRYLREQRVLYRMTVGADVVDVAGESILGLTFSSAAARELSALKLPADSDARRVLLLARPERMDDARLQAFSAVGECTMREATEQAAYVEPASFVVQIPDRTIDSIVNWSDANASRDTAAFEAVLKRRAVVATTNAGVQIIETIDRLGPNRLFGIRTAAAGSAPDAPALLMHGTACEHRIGSGRIWTEVARDFAELGMTAQRYDRRGTGDTGITTTDFPRIYSDVSKQDVLDAVDATGVTPDRLMVTGVCSGAWSAAYAGISRNTKSVVLVNSILYALRNVEVGPERLLGMTPQSPGRTESPEATTAKAKAKNLIRRLLPYRAWLLLGRLGLAQVPEVMLIELRRRNVGTDLVLSPADLAWFEKQRGAQSLARVADAYWSPNVIPAPSGDHPLLQRDLQNFTRRHLALAAIRDFGALLAPAEVPEPAGAVRTDGR